MPLSKVNRPGLNTGVTDNSDATAITIDSSENVTFAGNVDTADVRNTGDLSLTAFSSNTSMNSGLSAKILLDNAGTGYGQITMTTGGGGAGTFNGLNIDPNGRVTKPSQPYFFAKTGRAGDGYTDNPYQFRNVVHNVGGHFKTSSGTGQWSRFTAPVSGKYLFTAFPAYLQSGVNFSVRITVNGGTQGELARFIQGSAASHCGFTCSTILNLSANDYVELQAGFTPYHLNTTTNFFSGMLIG